MPTILSASESGISMVNSSSMAITTSTASRESSDKSSLNKAVSETFVGSTCSIDRSFVQMYAYKNVGADSFIDHNQLHSSISARTSSVSAFCTGKQVQCRLYMPGTA